MKLNVIFNFTLHRAETSLRTSTQPRPAAAPDDCRCVCGSLLARVCEEGVELKCRRCKRTLVVALPEGWEVVRADERPVRAIRS